VIEAFREKGGENANPKPFDSRIFGEFLRKLSETEEVEELEVEEVEVEELATEEMEMEEMEMEEMEMEELELEETEAQPSALFATVDLTGDDNW
jgi:Ran GTPase-activating protein (RanGAP) involved in mRNA processing and transport